MAHLTRSLVSLTLGVALMSGCAGSIPPNDRMASSEAAIRGADEVGARQVPQAALNLKLAEEQTAQAKVAMKNGDNDQARLLLIRAQADADLSLAMAKEASARQGADDSESKLRSFSSQPH